jgi:hypothetical protein
LADVYANASSPAIFYERQHLRRFGTPGIAYVVECNDPQAERHLEGNLPRLCTGVLNDGGDRYRHQGRLELRSLYEVQLPERIEAGLELVVDKDLLVVPEPGPPERWEAYWFSHEGAP